MGLPKTSIVLVVLAFLILGYVFSQPVILNRLFPSTGVLYQHSEAGFQDVEFLAVDWQQLLGNNDKILFENLRQQQEALQSNGIERVDKMESDLLLSALKANTWHALDGYQINETLAEQWIKIPGFIVPLELVEQRLISFFIVPYFGACLHFPPPPANQIIYVQLSDSIEVPSIQTPFLFSGRLHSELFEDPLGTSAWSLDILEVREYKGEADSTRLHQ